MPESSPERMPGNPTYSHQFRTPDGRAFGIEIWDAGIDTASPPALALHSFDSETGEVKATEIVEITHDKMGEVVTALYHEPEGGLYEWFKSQVL